MTPVPLYPTSEMSDKLWQKMEDEKEAFRTAAPPSLDALKSTESSSPVLVTATENSTASSRATAGRELDALIAEKVMGEPYPAPITAYPWWSSAPVMSPRKQWVASVHPDGSDPAKHIWVPRYYSTHIAEAWLVVERLRERRLDFYLRFVSSWTAEFDSVRSGANGYADGDTAALAICLAALKAVGA